MYITFEDYKGLGGKAEESAFPLLEKLSAKKLDSWTPYAAHPLAVDDDVCLAMVVLVNAAHEAEKSKGGRLQSYSVDGQSESYKTESAESMEQSLYNQVREIIPKNLTRWVL